MKSPRRVETPTEAKLYGVKIGRTIPERLKLTRPTFSGQLPVKVGRATHHALAGSLVAHVSQGGRQLVFILAPGRHLHCLVEGGEVEIPEGLREAVIRKHFPGN